MNDNRSRTWVEFVELFANVKFSGVIVVAIYSRTAAIVLEYWFYMRTIKIHQNIFGPEFYLICRYYRFFNFFSGSNISLIFLIWLLMRQYSFLDLFPSFKIIIRRITVHVEEPLYLWMWSNHDWTSKLICSCLLNNHTVLATGANATPISPKVKI